MKDSRKAWLILFVFALLSLSLTACSATKDEPARVAEKFLRAAAENDLATLEETVDPDLTEDVMSMMFFQIGLQALVGGGSSEFVELNVETISNDGQRATAWTTGKVRTSALGTQMTTPFDTQVPLVKKGGQWYVTSQ